MTIKELLSSPLLTRETVETVDKFADTAPNWDELRAFAQTQRASWQAFEESVLRENPAD